ncbi:Piso0_002454 [Millerozyma farinosa CBS 7064]|uniref:Piso0_002454 protein n=1 Tax=Pichia sorbitophila (strain ATCC MYA-4447 / BCRC 22081 / CBS 7064 / NBRC 10061 / NRRL Y-12695) TaxID=559304 RepID=G8YCN2_PICSO|nr:Piso0_002454 [Millerozyma farinosa CBS 7064]
MKQMLGEILGDKHLVLDGALGTELESIIPSTSKSQPRDDPLWSTRVLINEPKLVEEVHYRYLMSGSNIITTCTYQASLCGLLKYGDHFSKEDALGLWQKSVDVGKSAARRYYKECSRAQRVLIAGSIGPYGAYLADGSEYSGNYGDFSNKQLEQFHFDLMKFLILNKDVDLIGVETLPSLREFKVLFKLFLKLSNKYNSNKKIYFSFDFKNEHVLCDGSSMENVFFFINKHLAKSQSLANNILAIGCNCIDYKLVTSILEQFKYLNTFEVPTIVYPNFGFTYNKGTDRYKAHKDLDKWKRLANEWLDYNVKLIGGCCSTGPQEIKIISDLLKER